MSVVIRASPDEARGPGPDQAHKETKRNVEDGKGRGLEGAAQPRRDGEPVERDGDDSRPVKAPKTWLTTTLLGAIQHANAEYCTTVGEMDVDWRRRERRTLHAAMTVQRRMPRNQARMVLTGMSGSSVGGTYDTEHGLAKCCRRGSRKYCSGLRRTRARTSGYGESSWTASLTAGALSASSVLVSSRSLSRNGSHRC